MEPSPKSPSQSVAKTRNTAALKAIQALIEAAREEGTRAFLSTRQGETSFVLDGFLVAKAPKDRWALLFRRITAAAKAPERRKVCFWERGVAHHRKAVA